MIRSALSKVLWMARATSTIVGLAIMLALVFGVASAGARGTGGNFILGNANSAGAVSKLTASIANPALELVNQSTASAATALSLNVASASRRLRSTPPRASHQPQRRPSRRVGLRPPDRSTRRHQRKQCEFPWHLGALGGCRVLEQRLSHGGRPRARGSPGGRSAELSYPDGCRDVRIVGGT